VNRDVAADGAPTPPGRHLSEATLIELIHSLLAGDERAAAARHLRDCQQCEKQLMVLLGEHERARARMPVRGAGGAFVRSPGASGEAADSRVIVPDAAVWRRRPTLVAVLAVAAAVAAAVLFSPQALHRAGSPIESPDYWIPRALHVGETRAPGMSPDLEAAIDAYQGRDLDRVIALLADRFVYPDDVRGRLYLGSALALSGRYQEALGVLEPDAIDLWPPEPRAIARWYRYVALAALGRDREAGRLLDRLAGEPGEIGELARRQKGMID